MKPTPTSRASGTRKRLPPSKVRRQLHRHLDAIKRLAHERREARKSADEWRVEQRTIELEQHFDAIHALQVAYPKHVRFKRAPEWLVGEHYRKPRRSLGEPEKEPPVYPVHIRRVSPEDLDPDRAEGKSRAQARL